MALQILKTDSGYKVVADITVPQVIEFAFESVEDAVTKFKELEQGGTVVIPPTAEESTTPTTDTVVEPGV